MAEDVAPKHLDPEPAYLGDGVYARFDGYQLYVWTSNGITNSPEIAIEQEVLQNLNSYADRFWGPQS